MTKRTFQGIVLDWIDKITEEYPQRKFRGITLKDLNYLKRKLKEKGLLR